MVDLVAFGHIGDRGFLLLHDGLVHVGMPADRPKLPHPVATMDIRWYRVLCSGAYIQVRPGWEVTHDIGYLQRARAFKHNAVPSGGS